MDALVVKISVTTKITDSSLININKHLRLKNAITIKELVRKCINDF